MPASRSTPTVTRRWLSTTELVESQGVSRSLISELKRTGILKAGIHYRRLGNNPKSRLQWLETEVEAALLTIASEPEALEVIK